MKSAGQRPTLGLEKRADEKGMAVEPEGADFSGLIMCDETQRAVAKYPGEVGIQSVVAVKSLGGLCAAEQRGESGVIRGDDAAGDFDERAAQAANERRLGGGVH